MQVPKSVKICRKVFQAKLIYKKSTFITSCVLETVEYLIIWDELS